MDIKMSIFETPKTLGSQGTQKTAWRIVVSWIFTELESDRCTQKETHDWSAQLILNWTQKVRNCKTQHTFWVLWVENQILHTFSTSANCKMNNIKWISLKTLKIRGCQGEQTALPKEMWFYDFCKTRESDICTKCQTRVVIDWCKKIKIHDQFGQLILNWTHKVRNCKTQYFWVLLRLQSNPAQELQFYDLCKTVFLSQNSFGKFWEIIRKSCGKKPWQCKLRKSRRRRSPPQNQEQKHVEEEGTKILNRVDSFQDPPHMHVLCMLLTVFLRI